MTDPVLFPIAIFPLKPDAFLQKFIGIHKTECILSSYTQVKIIRRCPQSCGFR